MTRRTMASWALALGLCEAGCVAPPGSIGDLPADTDSAGTTMGGSTGDHEEATTTGDEGDSVCGPEGPSCAEDPDNDCVAEADDNAPGVPNPGQEDMDGDGIGDVIDGCPSAASSGDADGDGLADECDPCSLPPGEYENPAVALPGYMRVRNIPSVADFDRDGIGDVCDNCIMANCPPYEIGAEWDPGDPIDPADPACQTDANADMVGDACEGLVFEGASGPIGMGPDDDFDQDGLTNVLDACPRQHLQPQLPCVGDGDCPDGRKCETAVGYCDHLDTDADGVGDICDSCPSVENPLQVADGAMQDGDDSDDDFVGNACEPGAACANAPSPTRTAFYPVSVGGWCCTTQFPGDGSVLDPDGVPLTLECTEQERLEGICRRLPATVALAPGQVLLPPGCDDALAAEGLTVQTHEPLTLDDWVAEELWEFSCRLPPLDQDFDGLGDACDLCPLDFDPSNQTFIDPAGMVWPELGKYCNGDYAPQHTCTPPS